MSSDKPVFHDDGSDHDGEDQTRFMMSTLRGSGRHDDDDDDNADMDDEDETLGERLLGLTEMLPAPIRNATANVLKWTWNGSKWLLSVSRTGLWVIASSATILALPVMFESERLQIEEQQLTQQRQLMLGPNAAMGSSVGHGLMPAGAFPQVSPPGH